MARLSFPTDSGTRIRAADHGDALASLASSDLGENFYSWRGASGVAYVCSVFLSRDEAMLRQFSQAVAIGVHRDGPRLSAVCVAPIEALRSMPGGLFAAHGAARIDEWHLHFDDDREIESDLRAALS